MAFGGPNEYNGKNMTDAHKGRGITSADFDRVVGHVVSTMRELGVSEDLIGEVGALVEPMRPDCTAE
jgi:hemoglobin